MVKSQARRKSSRRKKRNHRNVEAWNNKRQNAYWLKEKLLALPN